MNILKRCGKSNFQMQKYQTILQKPSASVLFVGNNSILDELQNEVTSFCDLIFANEIRPQITTSKAKSKKAKKEDPFDKFANNPDFFYLSVDQFDRKSIPVEELRNIISRFQFRPLAHDKKILLIDQAENLGEEGQNTILKLLEEPLDDSVIILTTLNENNLRETILSRCTKFTIPLSSERGAQQGGRMGGVWEPSSVPPTINQAFTEVEKIHKISETNRKYQKAEEFMNNLIANLSNSDDKMRYEKLKKLLKYRQLLSRNANLRLVLENAIIEMYD